MMDFDPGHTQRYAALRSWLDQEFEIWTAVFNATLDDAIQDLQLTIFQDAWDVIRARAGSDEEGLRESVALYERGLTDLFGFVRASGAVADALGWSMVKAGYRRIALESGVEITLRTALETGMYLAEQVPLADHRLYRSWVNALMFFLYQRGPDAPPHPGSASPIDEQVHWAYGALAALEDHHAFHHAFVAYFGDRNVRATTEALIEHPIEQVVEHEERLLGFTRFDLILNTGLRWLAGAGGRPPAEQE